jgi:uncharacterized protein YjeT (DUF2065 family)
MFGNQRTILRSFWTHALLWSAALIGYHCLIAAIKPKIGDIDWSTFPLYANVIPVWRARAIVPLLIFGGWLATLCWLWRSKSRSVPIVVAIAFVLALNVTTAMTRGGAPALWRPFMPIVPEARTEYFADINRVDPGPVAFVRNYTEIMPTLALHSRTHPPGPILYLWAVSRVFGNGVVAAALAAIIGTALSIYPFSLLARNILGPATSRYAIAMYAVTPSLVLFGATSMDGVFLFFPLLATYFFHKSWSHKPVLYSILAGLALSAAMFFTLISFCIGFLFTVEAILSIRYPALSRRIWRNLVWAGLTFLVVHGLLYLAAGYNIIRAFATARRMAGAYRSEIYSDFWHYLTVSIGNLAAFLIGIGVITVALSGREIAEAWSAWRAKRPTDLFSIALPVVVIVLAFAKIFTGETERTWLFLVPLAIPAAARYLDRHQNANPRSNAWCAVLILLFTQTLATEILLYTFW